MDPTKLFVLIAATVSLGINGVQTKADQRRSGQTPRVRNLNFADQDLIAVPKGLAKRARSLDLSNNSIYKISTGDLEGLESLETLDLESNSLVFVGHGSFKDLRHLHTLSLRNNRLLSLRADHFEGLFRLRLLDLGKNPLVRLEPSVFEGLYQLEELRLDGCSLISFQMAAVTNLLHLHTLDLSRNYLTSLDLPRVTRKLPPSLRTFGLSENPWTCDCRTKYLLDQLDSIDHLTWSSSDGVQPICCKPVHYSGIEWKRFSEENVTCSWKSSTAQAFVSAEELPELARRAAVCFGLELEEEQSETVVEVPRAEKTSDRKERELNPLFPEDPRLSVSLLAFVLLELVAIIVLGVVIVCISRRAEPNGRYASLVV